MQPLRFSGWFSNCSLSVDFSYFRWFSICLLFHLSPFRRFFICHISGGFSVCLLSAVVHSSPCRWRSHLSSFRLLYHFSTSCWRVPFACSPSVFFSFPFSLLTISYPFRWFLQFGFLFVLFLLLGYFPFPTSASKPAGSRVPACVTFRQTGSRKEYDVFSCCCFKCYKVV